MFANQAFATLLFVDAPEETERRVPGLTITSVQRSDMIVYPATGGFSYFCLVPARLASPLQRLEDRIVSRTGTHTAMRLLIVLERSHDRPPHTTVRADRRHRRLTGADEKSPGPGSR